MNETLVYIEIYVNYHTDSFEKVKIKSKTSNIYNVENNENILFSNYLFKDFMKDCIENQPERLQVIKPKDLEDSYFLKVKLRYQTLFYINTKLHKLYCQTRK